MRALDARHDGFGYVHDNVHHVAGLQHQHHLAGCNRLEILGHSPGDHAVEGRDQSRVVEVVARPREVGLPDLHHGVLLVVIGLRDQLPLDQFGGPVELRLGQVVLGLGLVHRGPVVGIVQPRQQVALLHLQAARCRELDQFSADPEGQFRLVGGLHFARERTDIIGARRLDREELGRPGHLGPGGRRLFLAGDSQEQERGCEENPKRVFHVGRSGW